MHPQHYDHQLEAADDRKTLQSLWTCGLGNGLAVAGRRGPYLPLTNQPDHRACRDAFLILNYQFLIANYIFPPYIYHGN